MAPHQRAACRIEHLHRTSHELRQQALGLAVQARRYHGNGRGGVRRSAHRKNIAQRVVGGNLAEAVGVVDKRAEKIYGLHLRFAWGNAHQRRVIGRG